MPPTTANPCWYGLPVTPLMQGRAISFCCLKRESVQEKYWTELDVTCRPSIILLFFFIFCYYLFFFIDKEENKHIYTFHNLYLIFNHVTSWCIHLSLLIFCRGDQRQVSFAVGREKTLAAATFLMLQMVCLMHPVRSDISLLETPSSNNAMIWPFSALVCYRETISMKISGRGRGNCSSGISRVKGWQAQEMYASSMTTLLWLAHSFHCYSISGMYWPASHTFSANPKKIWWSYFKLHFCHFATQLSSSHK